jgi:hypothetical protein
MHRLLAAEVRFVVIGVSGANYYARSGGSLFATQDRDLFLPPDAENLLTCWRVLLAQQWNLWAQHEPLGEPIDLDLAKKVVAHRAAVQATHAEGLEVDLTLEMKGFHFDEVWAARQHFTSEGGLIPVASLKQIVESKRALGRPKDLLFLATHDELLRRLLETKGPGEAQKK